MVQWWASAMPVGSPGDPALVPDTGNPLADALLFYGPLGVVLMLIVIGWLVPKAGLDRLKDDRDSWKAAFEQERENHQRTREAMAQMSESARYSTSTNELVVKVLEQFGHAPESRGGGG